MTAFSADDEMPSNELAPRRMIDGGAGERERRLIASAQLDRTASGAKARVAAALGGVFEPPAAPGAAPTGPERAARGGALPRSGTRWSPGIVPAGIVGAGIVGAIALSLWLPATPAASSNATLAPPSVAAEAEKPAAASPDELSQRAGLTQQKLPPRPDHLGPERPKEKGITAHGEPVSGLLAEVRALEAVSAAISAGQADRAARELDAYQRRFARGELAMEADVLAIQIAAARGDDATARAGAERLLALPEAEHYRARVRALLSSKAPASGAAIRENAGHARSNEAAAHIKARR